MRFAFCLLLGLLFVGCASTRHPIGMPLEDDLSQELTGRWANPEGSFQVHCDPEGNLSIAQLEWNENAKKFEAEGASGPLLQLGDELYVVNLKDDGEDQEEYMFALLQLKEEHIVCWGPDTSGLAELVKDGKVTGDTEGQGVTLTGQSEELAKQLKDAGIPNAFDWSDPIILWKEED